MRFDRLRRRPAHPPPSPLPTSPLRTSSSSLLQSPATKPSAPSLPAMSRVEYINALEARMEQMEKVPTSSFYQSYAGEFDMLLSEERTAARKIHEFETSTRVENAYRNRYANILSNEPTRVRLQAVPPGENDYINANRVTGHAGHPGYIATQAPLPDTTAHFWQMVYESKSPVIIMLTREHEEDCHMVKSERYWPSVRNNLLFNDYLVDCVDEKVHQSEGVVERRFHVGRVVDKRRKHARDLVDLDSQVPPIADNSVWQTPARSRSQPTCNEDDFDGDMEDLLTHFELIGPVLEVVQLQYMDWPDQDVPSSPTTLLDLCHRVDVLSIAQLAEINIVGPPIVHCSAGVGRTGTFIAIDHTLRRLWDAFSGPNGESRQPVCVDEILELVRTMKRERSKMVQTSEQYKFIYQSVLEGMKRWDRGQALYVERPRDERPNGDEER